jgi:hypothetical protein
MPRIIRAALGALLLAAAGLKVHSLAVDPFHEDMFLDSPRLLIATIEIEIVLGLWLLSGWAARAAWVSALGFFGLLAAVSFFLAYSGQRSCGCLGRVNMSPWVMFAVDLGAIAALAFWPPGRAPDTRPSALIPQLLRIGAGALALVTLTLSVIPLGFGSTAAALSWLRGEAVITADPLVSDVGKGAVREVRTFVVRLTNHSDRAVRLVEGVKDCECVWTKDLPLTLEKGESREVQLSMNFKGTPGRFQYRFVMSTDHERQPHLIVFFAGTVVPSPR